MTILQLKGCLGLVRGDIVSWNMSFGKEALRTAATKEQPWFMDISHLLPLVLVQANMVSYE